MFYSVQMIIGLVTFIYTFFHILCLIYIFLCTVLKRITCDPCKGSFVCHIIVTQPYACPVERNGLQCGHEKVLFRPVIDRHQSPSFGMAIFLGRIPVLSMTDLEFIAVARVGLQGGVPLLEFRRTPLNIVSICFQNFTLTFINFILFFIVLSLINII